MAPPTRRDPLRTPSRAVSSVAKPRQTAPLKMSQRKPANRPNRTHCTNPFTQQLDIAAAAGMQIDTNTMADGIQAANQAAIARIGSNGYDSDDDIGESEAMQAENLHSSLRDRLAKTDEQLHDQWLQDSERDYAQNASVLDQDIVSQKLEQLKVFAEHLHWAGKNRAGLLARMVEPLAENHWLIEPEFHQQFVDTFRGMGNLVNNLPDIAKAATAASQASGLLEQDSAESARQEKARQIAQIERLIHQVEQADEWFKSDSWGGFELTSFVSKTA